MPDWTSTLVYAVRTLRRQPTFALIALLTLTLGIGANTAIFSVIKTVVLNPLPYDDPDRIAVVWEVNPEGSQERVSVPTFGDWKSQVKSFESMAAFRQVDFTHAGTGDPRNVRGVRATTDLFRVLAADALLGRTFVPEESIVGADRVVVLSHGFWTRVLGGDRSLIGKTIQLDAVPFTVVGVMPPQFEFPTGSNVEVWTPLAFDPKDLHGQSRRARSLLVVGRLADRRQLRAGPAGIDRPRRPYRVRVQEQQRGVERARDGGQGTARRLVPAGAHGVDGRGRVPASDRLREHGQPAARAAVEPQARDRRSRRARRQPLGSRHADPGREPRAVGGRRRAGTAGAVGGLRLLTTLPEGQLPRMDQVELDGGVLLFTTVVSVAVAMLFGVLPAIHASRADLRETISESTGTTTGLYASRVLGGLVVVEVALALVLLVGAGLMTRSFSKLLQVSPGFESGNIVAARVLLPTTKYRERPSLVRFYEGVIERLRRAPGVNAASAVSALPLQDVGAAGALPFTVEGQQPPKTEDPLADVRIVAPAYFETMKIQLLDGRFLDERDAEQGPRTSVINETMRRRYFPDRSPLGQIIVNPHGKSEVVGVVADVRNQGLDREPKKQVYLPLRQSPTAGMAVVARTDGDPAAFAGAIQRVIWDVDPEQPIYELSTMDQILARAVFLPRLSTTLLALFALAALLLAALGHLRRAVLLRVPADQGDRPAHGLGASGGNTVGMVVRNSLLLIAIGGAIGLVAALLLARSMSGILYGIGPFDLPAFTLAAAVLVVAGIIASLLPARRATRVDPMVALREL